MKEEDYIEQINNLIRRCGIGFDLDDIKALDFLLKQNKQLKGSLQTHEILLRANVEENQKLKKQISNLECLVESIKLGVTLNQYQEDLLDKILFRSDKQ